MRGFFKTIFAQLLTQLYFVNNFCGERESKVFSILNFFEPKVFQIVVITLKIKHLCRANESGGAAESIIPKPRCHSWGPINFLGFYI